MIVFDLVCGVGHRFEGWFGSADEFDSQAARGLLSCPTCGDACVERVPSATRFNAGAKESVPEPKPDPAADPAFAGKDPIAIAQILYSRMVDRMLTTSEDVGEMFPAEARRIHYQEAPGRAIRGQASAEEHAELIEEGIPVLRFSIPSKDRYS